MFNNRSTNAPEKLFVGKRIRRLMTKFCERFTFFCTSR